MRSLSMSTRRTVAILAILAGVGVGAAESAAADHADTMFTNSRTSQTCWKGYVQNSTPCRADNSTHTVFFRSTVPSNVVSATSDSLTDSYHAGTDLSVIFHNSGTVSYSGGAETDVIYGGTSQNLPPGVNGWMYCDDPIETWYGAATKRCDQAYVIFNRNTTSSFSFSQAKSVGCHETGHTVGLLHGSDADPFGLSDGDSSLACMRTQVPNASLNPYMKAHNVHEVDRTYS